MSSSTWLEIFEPVSGWSPSFIQALDKQLVSATYELFSINLLDGSYALAPDDLEIKYTESAGKKLGSIEADLVCPDGEGYPVTIAWFSDTHPDKSIDPKDELPGEYNIQLFWAELPVDELREYAKPFKPPIKIKDDFSFTVEWKPFIWPDMSLEFHSQDDFSNTQLKQIEKAIDDSIASQNSKSSDKGKIHYRGDLKSSAKNSAELHIDFGSAPKTVLSKLLQAIDKNNNPCFMNRIVIRRAT
ncbi:MAG: hypothetical protein GY754_12025 [bacterium]|nr:hypothetical protein [bacterium]